MRQKNFGDRRCTYVVSIADSDARNTDWTSLSPYLSELAVANCEVVIVDGSSPEQFEKNSTVLRWLGRHVAASVSSACVNAAGGNAAPVDAVREAMALASCDKVIIASPAVRYSVADIEALCAALDVHEVVTPQEYLAPLPWWSAIDAAQLLVHRAVSHVPEHPRTFGIRRSAVRALVEPELSQLHPVDDLESHGAEVWGCGDLLVRREPATFGAWLRERPREAAHLFGNPLRTAVLFLLLPLALLLGAFDGASAVIAFAITVSLLSVGLALRGRGGVGMVFPLRACLAAPLAVLERSLTIYLALAMKLAGPGTVVVPVADQARAQKRAASGR
jgi:hypothetical protein